LYKEGSECTADASERGVEIIVENFVKKWNKVENYS
jgi:hypothetical protein